MQLLEGARVDGLEDGQNSLIIVYEGLLTNEQTADLEAILTPFFDRVVGQGHVMTHQVWDSPDQAARMFKAIGKQVKLETIREHGGEYQVVVGRKSKERVVWESYGSPRNRGAAERLQSRARRYGFDRVKIRKLGADGVVAGVDTDETRDEGPSDG